MTLLKHVAEIRVSNVDKLTVAGQIPVRLCNYTDVYYAERIRCSSEDYMAATATADQIRSFGLRVGDTVLTKDSETAEDIGISALVEETADDFVCGYHLAIVRPRAEEVDSRYLRWCVTSSYVRGQLTAAATGVTRMGLRTEALENVTLPILPREEQGRVADYLDVECGRIDSLIELKGQQIAMTAERRSLIITRATTRGLTPSVELKVSNVPWLGTVPMHWTPQMLKRLGPDISSGTSVNATDVPPADGEVGVLKTGAASKGWFDPNESKTVWGDDIPRVTCPVQADTLLLNRANTPSLVGSTAYVDTALDTLYLSDKLWQVRFSLASAKFIWWWTKTPEYRQQVESYCVGASNSMQNLAQDNFRQIYIALPPRDEQDQIAEYLLDRITELDRASRAMKHSVELLQERRQALITAAVTGQCDVASAGQLA